MAMVTMVTGNATHVLDISILAFWLPDNLKDSLTHNRKWCIDSTGYFTQIPASAKCKGRCDGTGVCEGVIFAIAIYVSIRHV